MAQGDLPRHASCVEAPGVVDGALGQPCGRTLDVTICNGMTGRLVFEDAVSEDITVGELMDRFVSRVPMQFLLGGRSVGEDDVLGRLVREGPDPDARLLGFTVVFEAAHLQGIFEVSAMEARTMRADDQATLQEMQGRFLVIAKAGVGTFAQVYKALRQDTDPERLVAIKKLQIDNEEGGIPAAQIREVSLVKQLDHPNIVKMLDIFTVSSALFLVFELMDMDLRAFMKANMEYFVTPSALYNVMKQCAEGLHHCHVQRIIHRDLKPQNILVEAKSMTLKLADFGLARSFSVPARNYTPEVVTLWYRAPELLLGQWTSSTALDIWSLACVYSEMATYRPLFPGDSEIDTLFRIFRQMGTPNETVWPGINKLPHFQGVFPQWEGTQLADVAERGPALGTEGIDLLRRCLAYDPQERLSSRRVLMHNFFMQTESTAAA